MATGAKGMNYPKRWMACLECGVPVSRHADSVQLTNPETGGKALLHIRGGCYRRWRRQQRRQERRD